MKTLTRKVPQSAMRAAIGRCEFLSPDPDDGDRVETQTLRGPIKLTASSGVPFTHWFWGRLVFDFAGMAHGERLTLDWCHDPDRIIGYADQVSTDSGQLTIAGELVAANDDDKAAELLVKGRAGVPYQGSIYFDPLNNLTIEEIQAGMSASVNGQQLAGPLTVIRTCLLRGAAMCPYGADPYTHSEFSQGDAGEVDVQITTQEEAMSKETETTAKTADQIRAELRQAHTAFVAQYGPVMAAKWGPLGEAELTIGSVHAHVQALEAEHSAALKSQTTAFEAKVAELQAKYDAERAAVTELQDRLAAVQLGETKPASSAPAGALSAEEMRDLQSHLTPNLARYVAATRAAKRAAA